MATVPSLRDLGGGLNERLVAVDDVLAQAGSTARRLEGSAALVEDQLDAATAELRLSIDAAARVLDRLRDPRAAPLGPGSPQFGPGESKP